MITTKQILISILVACLVQIMISLKNQTHVEKMVTIEKSDTNSENSHKKQRDIDFGGDFKPLCKITDKYAISAMRRAKTQFCKHKIANISCLIQKGNYYPQYLPHSCPFNGTQYRKYLGCYADKSNPRLLSHYKKTYAKKNTRQSCVNKCYLEGYAYAGVQYAVECFCGNDRPPSSSKLPENACDMICSGMPDEICGGRFTINVFETGVGKFISQNPTIPSDTSSEGSVRIVFLLTINGRALRQVHRLINALYRTHHYIYIHVDARHDYLQRKLSALEKRFPNIKLVTPRLPTIWGGVSLLKTLLSSMRNVFRLGWEWDFVINLSECGFPIKSIESLEKFLAVNKGYNFLKSTGNSLQKFVKKQGLSKTFVECEERMWLIGDRILPRGMIVDGGSDWFALSRQFVSYIVGPRDEFLSGLERVFNHTIFTPESYFHTVLRNTRFCNTKVNKNMHIVNWNRTQGCKCQCRHIVDWCGCSPMVFKLDHWRKIEKTKNEQLYFGRKFEPIINQQIINKVEKFIGVNDHDSIKNLDAYWENLFDIEDSVSSKDDLLLSHAESITRIHANNVNNEECNFVPGEVVEINIYNKADVYEGNLVLHKAKLEGKDIILETMYKPKKFSASNPSDENHERVKIFKVSSQYDQKEKVFRNFADILGPFTEPVLVYEILPNAENKTENFTIFWLDPAGRVANINKIHVNTKNHSNFINSNLVTPTLTGIWKVGLFQGSKLIGQTKFLITPLEYLTRKKLSSENAVKINGGSQNSYPMFPRFNLSEIFSNEVVSNSKQELSATHSNKIHHDLPVWIDTLSIQYYDVMKSCVSETSHVKVSMKCGDNVIGLCELTEWSSLSPDPKGTVGNVNKITGKLERLIKKKKQICLLFRYSLPTNYYML